MRVLAEHHSIVYISHPICDLLTDALKCTKWMMGHIHKLWSNFLPSVKNVYAKFL